MVKQIFTLSFLFLVLMTGRAEGLSTERLIKSKFAAPTSLNAWSMPVPSFSSQSFASFSAPSWYIDVANPAARRPVYNDSPKEYNFLSPGDDWPSSFDIVEEAQKQQQQRSGPFSPIRRAAKWARNRGLMGPNQV